MSQATLSPVRVPVNQPRQEHSSDQARAVLAGGRHVANVVHALAALWRRGDIIGMAESLAGIKRTLSRTLNQSDPPRIATRRIDGLLSDLITRSTRGKRGPVSKDDIQQAKTLFPELASKAQSYVSVRSRKGQPLTDSQRTELGKLWANNRTFIFRMAKRYSHSKTEDLIGLLAERLCQRHILELIDPDYSDDSFRSLVLSCFRFCLYRLLEKKQAHPVSRFRLLPHDKTIPSEAESVVFQKERTAIVLHQIASLPESSRDGIISHYFNEESQVEIAQRWGCRYPKQVREAIQQGLRQLKTTIPKAYHPGQVVDRGQMVCRMLKLRDDGLSWAVIADRFGYSIKNVRDLVKAFNPARDFTPTTITTGKRKPR